MWLINCRIWWHRLGLRTWITSFLMVVTDQLQNLMMETGFQNLNYLLLMVTQTGLNFHSLVYISYMTTYFVYFLILVIDYMGGWVILLINVFQKHYEMTVFSEYSENSNQPFYFFLPFLIQIKVFYFQSRLFPNMKNNGNIMVMLKSRAPWYPFIWK